MHKYLRRRWDDQSKAMRSVTAGKLDWSTGWQVR